MFANTRVPTILPRLMFTLADRDHACRTQSYQTCHHRKPSLAASTATRLNSNPDEPEPLFSKCLTLKSSDENTPVPQRVSGGTASTRDDAMAQFRAPAIDTEFFRLADIMDSDVGQTGKDDPAQVATDGLEAMMSGAGKVGSGFKTRYSPLPQTQFPQVCPLASQDGGTGVGKNLGLRRPACKNLCAIRQFCKSKRRA